MNIHRDILETVKPTKVLKTFIDKNTRKIEINIFNRIDSGFIYLHFSTKKLL
jgi:hypothetical protein